MVKRLLSLYLVFIMLFFAGCSNEVQVSTGKSSYQVNGVSITDKGNYLDVVLDYSTGLTHRQMGEAFAKGILETVPDYEALVDSYIAESLMKNEYPYAFNRVEDIKPQINKEYSEEIEGMASVFSGGNNNVWKDNKISRDEFFLFNLFTDSVRGTQCSFISVFGSRSENHKAITARNLDWYGGSQNQLPRIQAVITIKYKDKKICSVGYLGYMGVLTGFNNSKVFAGILDAGTNAPYSSEGRRSYTMDLRYALEKYEKMDDVAEYMRDPSKLYAYNHVIGFSDPDKSFVLENNFSGGGIDSQRVKRAFRNADSKLNKGISWGVSDAVASVNSFVLYGNNDNHKPNKFNTKRWENIKKQLMDMGPTVSAEEMKRVASFNHGSPGVFSESGDIYNKMTLQMVVFQPDSLSLEVFFRPRGFRKNPDNPVFEKVTVFQ
ncbi:MAG: C45 family autoproteolytic acyltransferase/hydrolase [Clostridia bacterium]|nr:C45 family autoproteolytic acyltransferase/hydrolase [Clostridia bacterium]